MTDYSKTVKEREAEILSFGTYNTLITALVRTVHDHFQTEAAKEYLFSVSL